jgi:hypothetical protein
VYLLYLDESGRATAAYENYFVVGGIALHEEDCYPLARAIDKRLSRLLPSEPGLELHASRIWSARSEWSHVDRPTRIAILETIFRDIVAWRSPAGRSATLFAVAVKKADFAASPIELAHQEIFKRFDAFLTRLHHQGQSHRSLVIADNNEAYEKLLQGEFLAWKSGRTRYGRLHSFADVPLYVDSKASRLVQLADFVAWATWHYYENNHVQWMQLVNPAFDSEGGVQHGLVHLSGAHKRCLCVPCVSRRDAVIAATVPLL